MLAGLEEVRRRLNQARDRFVWRLASFQRRDDLFNQTGQMVIELTIGKGEALRGKPFIGPRHLSPARQKHGFLNFKMIPHARKERVHSVDSPLGRQL